MSAENVTRTIQLILAPVVMITACALLLNGLLSRYDALNARLRIMGRERLDLLRTPRTLNDAGHRAIAGDRPPNS